MTAIARVLCLCLMSFHSRVCDQEWRNEARARLPGWKTSFDYTRSQIPEAELRQHPVDSEHSNSSNCTSSEPSHPSRPFEPSTSEYQPSSSPVESPTAKGSQVQTQSRSGCGLNSTIHRDDSPDSIPDFGGPTQQNQRECGYSQVTSSPPVQRASRPENSQHVSGSRYQQHSAQFCTQQCLLGLQQGGQLDNSCPNVMLHRQGADDSRHCIDSAILVQQLKQQLDGNIDHNFTPMRGCGASGAPFKLTCAAYGYTMVGKGTTSWLWSQVSREAEVYGVLQQAQGSAVPGAINLANIYFLLGAGERFGICSS